MSKQVRETFIFLVFFEKKTWDPSKKLDLAISFKTHQSRALHDLIWPTWWQAKAHLFKILENCMTQLWKQILPPLFFQIQALEPFLGARSRDLLQKPPIESSVRFNLTYLVTKERSVFASKIVFSLPHTCTYYLHCLQRHHHRKDGKRYLLVVFTLNPAIPSGRWWLSVI